MRFKGAEGRMEELDASKIILKCSIGNSLGFFFLLNFAIGVYFFVSLWIVL